MFKKVIITILLVVMCVAFGFAQDGTYTTNGYFYMPLYGAYGTVEFDEYNAYMEIADNQIEANKVMGEASVDTSGVPVANDIARFTDLNTIEGRSYAELKAALDLEIGTDVLAEQTIGIGDDNLVEIDDADAANNDYAKFTANGLEGRSYAELKTDLAYQLSDLSDVNTSTATDKFVLIADGVDFESRQLTSDDLSDVTSIGMLDEEETVIGNWTFSDHFYISRYEDTSGYNPYLGFVRGRDGDPTWVVQDDDALGAIYFYGSTGEGTISLGAMIRSKVDGTSGVSDMPGRLGFYTTPDNDYNPDLRLEIDNAGNIKMGDGAWTNYVNVSAAGVMTPEGSASITATDLVITSQAAGDILYFNGTNWIRLPKGTAGQVLTMNAGGTAPEWQTP